MKATKKIVALVLTVIMVMSLMSTAFAADGEYSITINNKLNDHTYEAYQIFAGDLAKAAENDAAPGTNAVLSNIRWGTGVTCPADGIVIGKDADNNEIKSTNAAEVAEALADKDNSLTLDALLAALTLTNVKATSTDKGDTYVIENLDPGYYLVKDQNGSLNGDHDAYTSYIIEVVENSTVNPKSAFPSVDKQVWDETGDAEEKATNGWGETADHAINESFQFKLIATLPEDADFGKYDKYKVVFTDTMSDGITFESIASVTVDGITLNNTQYECTATAGKAGGSWTLTIANVKVDGVNLNNGAIIEVVYNAHLNKDAVIGDQDDNKNTVYLEYSNNPNANGENDLGKTPEDTVWVFTYMMKNTKTDGDGAKLADAVFAIKNAEGKYYGGVVNGVVTWVTSENPVNDDNVYKVTSNENGDFSVVGLDVGTYILTEIVTPAGFNTCADVEVVISAVHEELNKDEAKTTITMTKDKEQATEIIVINQAGSTLPETGGIGTTIFYAIGGLLVLAAVVLLVTKKRMADAE